MYYAKVLNLSVVNPEVSQRSITINALGCENSLREIKDGVTFFGAKKKNAQGQVINDLVFPLVAKNFAKNYRGSHFQISYDVSKDSYFIKDLKVGFGTFYRLSDSIDLKNNTLFHIANSFILASFIDQEQEYSRLQLKVYGKCAGDVFYFNASDYSENYITIGRQENCEVRLQGNLVSKIHCTVFYTPEKGWILSDGDMKNYSNSTNGVWVYINEPVELAHSMLFKSGRIVFQVSIL